MGTAVGIARAALNTSTGNQDFTDSNLGGATPKGALFIVTRATTNGTPLGNASFGYGAADGTNQWACAARSQNAQGTTRASSIGMTDQCLYVTSNTGVRDAEAGFVSFIADGVRVNITDAPLSAYIITVILFTGSDVSFYAGTHATGNQDVATDITAPGFEPTLVLSTLVDGAFDDTNIDPMSLSLGVCHNDGAGTERQTCWNLLEPSFQADGDPRGKITSIATDKVAASANSYTIQYSNFDANGFTSTVRDANATSGAVVGYAAIKLGVSAKVNVIDSPTATGNWAVTDAGFTPQFVLLGLTFHDTIDSYVTTNLAGSVGTSVFTENVEACNTVQIEDASATTDTQSSVDNEAVFLQEDDGTVGYDATFTSLDTNGWTLNFSNVWSATSRKWWYLAIEEDIASGVGASSGIGIGSAVGEDASIRIDSVAEAQGIAGGIVIGTRTVAWTKLVAVTDGWSKGTALSDGWSKDSPPVTGWVKD